ncbi:MAG TPA: TetR/AcrR family transcriptional regulator [Coxiellaceae bacterium]|nr:TetR/AcrR family transcriptional regulator [Coxiellaceae bacterium]
MSDALITHASKNKLIDVSIEHFIKDGYRASALSKIASEANLDKSTIYHHFNSKTDIAIQAIKKVGDFYEKSLFSIVNKPTFNPEDKIIEFIKTLKLLITASGIQLIVLPTFIFENVPELIEPVQSQRERWIKVMSELLSPLYSPYLSEKFSRSAWRLIVGTFVDMKVEPSAERQLVIVAELESALKRLWLKETF